MASFIAHSSSQGTALDSCQKPKEESEIHCHEINIAPAQGGISAGARILVIFEQNPCSVDLFISKKLMVQQQVRCMCVDDSPHT